MHFNGEARHEWPEFATSFLALGADEGGWEQALEMQLDLQVATNKRLNKMAWCYLTLMLEGSALDEMDMVPDKNAYEVWQHLKETYEPRKEKAHDYLKMKFVQCEMESLKEVNNFLEEEIMDANEDQDEVKSESIREEEAMEDIEVKSDLEANETVQEEFESLVEGRDDKPTREEDQEDHEEFAVESREHAEMGIQNDNETIQVEIKEKDGEKDAKDGKEYLLGEEEVRNHHVKGGEKCLIGDEEVWMIDENAVYLFHEETRHSMEKKKGRESQKARKDEPMEGELERKIVPKIVREAVSRFKEKANE